MELGFIGLGHLGKSIAGRLVDCGHSLTVWNRSPAKGEGMPVKMVPSPQAVANETDIVFICLFDSNAVDSVLGGQNGLLSGSMAGKIIADLSTNHFEPVLTFHERCRNAGAVYLEAPVLGSVVPASQGALTVLVSGDKIGYDKAKPVLENIAKHLFYLGKPALATKMKLINNLTLGSFMATIAEALSFGEKIGIEKKRILEILSAGGGNSLVLNAKREKLLQEDFSTHFSNALIYKDLHCLQDLAYTENIPLFTGSLIKELYAQTFPKGIDQEDFCAIYKLFQNS